MEVKQLSMYGTCMWSQVNLAVVRSLWVEETIQMRLVLGGWYSLSLSRSQGMSYMYSDKCSDRIHMSHILQIPFFSNTVGYIIEFFFFYIFCLISFHAFGNFRFPKVSLEMM